MSKVNDRAVAEHRRIVLLGKQGSGLTWYEVEPLNTIAQRSLGPPRREKSFKFVMASPGGL